MYSQLCRSPLQIACEQFTKPIGANLLKSPTVNLTQDPVSGKTPFDHLLVGFTSWPKHNLAEALQFLLNHPEASKIVPNNLSPQLRELILKLPVKTKQPETQKKKRKFHSILDVGTNFPSVQ